MSNSSLIYVTVDIGQVIGNYEHDFIGRKIFFIHLTPVFVFNYKSILYPCVSQ